MSNCSASTCVRPSNGLYLRCEKLNRMFAIDPTELFKHIKNKKSAERKRKEKKGKCLPQAQHSRFFSCTVIPVDRCVGDVVVRPFTGVAGAPVARNTPSCESGLKTPDSIFFKINVAVCLNTSSTLAPVLAEASMKQSMLFSRANDSPSSVVTSRRSFRSALLPTSMMTSSPPAF